MYTHLMTLEDCERASRSCGANEKSAMFDRLLEIALEQATNLERLLEQNVEIKETLEIINNKLECLKESMEEEEQL